MIDQMVDLRRQGITHAAIADQLGCAERTVRRHTEGVTPQLVHVADPTPPDLVEWYITQMADAARRGKLTARELDRVILAIRETVASLDPATVEYLEGDLRGRMAFLRDAIMPAVASEIRTERLIQRIKAECGGDP